jgi:hypothetical protein
METYKLCVFVFYKKHFSVLKWNSVYKTAFE